MDDDQARTLIAERTGWSPTVAEGVRRYLRDRGVGAWQLLRMIDSPQVAERELSRLAGIGGYDDRDTAWLVEHVEAVSAAFARAHTTAQAREREGMEPADWTAAADLAREGVAAWQALAGRRGEPDQVCAALHAAARFQELQRSVARWQPG
ncbi:hypothetical protein ASC77_08235 [Nocardioides sp. Root1257]|uniref:hypothetical protein n=1 Tax=unclassified Nocardioides TaxID=2615069 RepID=UPI0006F2E84E|nr:MULTISPECIES: hypothetical protein [unclassified Nocardioides]KQW48714.1 hypothetical protein ASC77_08235 [Nocardioides sp. Root1257]KRC47889.1 hypothetical protein ASE24_08240 [Nocardioides sp. Root224]